MWREERERVSHLPFVGINLPNCTKIIKTSILKGVAERSSVFASEIFTAILQIPEEPPEIIHINEMHEMPWKEMAILD